MSVVVLACPACQAAWAADLRHATSSCPSCQARVELRGRKFLWQGEDAREAQAAAAAARLRSAGLVLQEPPARAPRHDSALDAAAAKGRPITNKSARAEAVAAWLQRLAGRIRHGEFVEALQRAGLDRERAEAEVTRMLATDLLMEPRSGEYQVMA